VVEKLLTYGTGAPISFHDRETVDRCIEKSSQKDFGFRSLLHAVIQSDLFLNK